MVLIDGVPTVMVRDGKAEPTAPLNFKLKAIAISDDDGIVLTLMCNLVNATDDILSVTLALGEQDARLLGKSLLSLIDLQKLDGESSQ